MPRTHLARLRSIHRSSGWPCHDSVEVELQVAGYLEVSRDEAGRERLRLTDAGLAALARSLEANRAARSAHEALADRVARWQQREGRVVWRNLSLRAPLDVAPTDEATQPAGRRWVTAQPDVFSLRLTTVEHYLLPRIHEVKVSRADLLSDLRNPDKRGAYQAMAQELVYVLGPSSPARANRPIADPDEIPLECGVMLAGPDRLELVRAPVPRPFEPFRLDIWMALARATPCPDLNAEDQGLL